MFNRLVNAVRRILGSAISTAREPADWFVDWVRGQRGETRVTAETAVTLPEVWYALSRIAGHVGGLPLHVYERTGEQSKAKARKHAAWRLHHRRPNPNMAAAVFRETLMVHALLRGNGRGWILRDATGRPVRIDILPTSTQTVLVNGAKWHVVDWTDEEGKPRQDVIPDRDVLHIIGLSFNGIVGIDLIKYASNSIGLGLSALRAARKSFDNYGVPGLLLSAPAGVFPDPKDAAEFLERFRQLQEGPENAGKTALLREGITATTLSQSHTEMQMAETRKLSRQDAALWFLLESIVGDDTSASYNTLEQKNLAYLSNCLMRWLTRMEQECDEKLLTEKEKDDDSHFHRFMLAALLRSDTKSQAETLAKLIAARVINPNQARDTLEMDRYDGGDEYANPAITPGSETDDPPRKEAA